MSAVSFSGEPRLSPVCEEACRMRDGGSLAIVVLAPAGELLARRLEASLLAHFPGWRFGLWAGEGGPRRRIIVAERRPRFLRMLSDWTGRPEFAGVPAGIIDAGEGSGAPEAEAAARSLLGAACFARRRVLAGRAGSRPAAAFWAQAAREASESAPSWFLEQTPGEHAEQLSAGRLSPGTFWMKQLEYAEIWQCMQGCPAAACRGGRTALALLRRDICSGSADRPPCGAGVAGAALFARGLAECFRRRFAAFSRPLAFYGAAALASRQPGEAERLWQTGGTLRADCAGAESLAMELLAEARKASRGGRPAEAFSDPLFYARLLTRSDDFLSRFSRFFAAGFTEAHCHAG